MIKIIISLQQFGMDRSVVFLDVMNTLQCSKQWRLTPKQAELVEKAGFSYFRSIPTIVLDNSLISALVERWRRETNTFHLPVGEMTVTLEDVALILGLPIDGNPVIGVPVKTPHSVCEDLLGKAPKDLNGGMLKLNWLRECFSRCPDDAPVEEIERHTRAYLLYLVGCTIFSTTTGNKVSVTFLPLFEKFDEAGKYAWGAAALAFLYRALGNASLKSQGTISGSLTLLQVERKINGIKIKTNIVAYRKALDSLQPSDVKWFPYKDFDYTVIPEGRKTPPDRCLRQFGMPQPIPEDVQIWERKIPAVDQGVDLSKDMESGAKGKCAQRLGNGWSVDSIFWKVRKVLMKARTRSGMRILPAAAMREIANIADSLLVEQMEFQDRKLLDEIKSTVHVCLTDVVGNSKNGRCKNAVKLHEI
ncbi:Aminotransferase-like, plant mobile domain family protein [Prunus dulcis]|uniref:Aminotransferase-like, plant mobile domain family protein n=1 Tax=Prunus dulcis TaxID=3755 RepID=A0A4Y1R430_PRUDU|nr:Aminotransferase-like, plant mobile domain family protein [Prunus dulcis]